MKDTLYNHLCELHSSLCWPASQQLLSIDFHKMGKPSPDLGSLIRYVFPTSYDRVSRVYIVCSADWVTVTFKLMRNHNAKDRSSIDCLQYLCDPELLRRLLLNTTPWVNRFMTQTADRVTWDFEHPVIVAFHMRKEVRECDDEGYRWYTDTVSDVKCHTIDGRVMTLDTASILQSIFASREKK